MVSFEELEEQKTYLRRENLTWEGSRMMLPEHKQALRLQKEMEKKVEKPSLDPDELQEIGYIVMDALEYTKLVCVTYWKDGHYYEQVGYINKVAADQSHLRIEDKGGEQIYISVKALKSVEKI
ncbi:YolD-like family protein [Alkalihalobacillus sp. FSL R5-0424]